MTGDNVKDISDYRKKNDAADADGSAVSNKNPPAGLSEKLRNATPFGLRIQVRQQMKSRHGL